MRYPHSPKATIIIFLLLLAALVVLAGCNLAPTIGYEHLSDAGVSGDGHDLACAGLRTWESEFEAKASICQNLHATDRHIHYKINIDWSPE